MTAPKVSVLMSCYNASRWLHEAIDSVLVQTFEDFEFILVDDGSTDETCNIIRNYADRDKRIVVISKKNTGLPDSLNAAIKQAKGQWIARLDSDDLCDPTRLEQQVNFVNNHPQVVLLGTGSIEIDGQGHAIRKFFYPPDHKTLVRRLERLQWVFPHSSAFYRTDIVKQIGGYNPRISAAEDLRLWLELALRGEIACLPRPLVRIRQHASQITKVNKRRVFCDAMAAEVCYFLQKAHCKDPSVEAGNDEWLVFLNWVDRRMLELGAFERYKAWNDARADYFSAHNPLAGLCRFGIRLLQSGHAGVLVWEKFFGYSLPQRLAREWMTL